MNTPPKSSRPSALPRYTWEQLQPEFIAFRRWIQYLQARCQQRANFPTSAWYRAEGWEVYAPVGPALAAAYSGHS